MTSGSGRIPSEKERILAKKALKLATEGSKLSRELRDEDISVRRVELLVPASILDHTFSSFMAAGADGLGDAPLGDDTDVDTDWPGL